MGGKGQQALRDLWRFTYRTMQIIDRANIDREKGTFKEDRSRFISNSMEIYCSPEIIIIKNDIGRDLFNQLAAKLLCDYKEKGIRPIGDVAYPYYVLNMDWITTGCQFGVWEYFDHQPNEIIDCKSMEDDFEAFKLYLEPLL